MRTPKPNLFLIGAMKSGTTFLSELLAEHPAIFMSTPKEPCHFVDPKALQKIWPHMWRRGYWRSREKYLSLFAGAANASVIGEASTLYSYAPMVSDVASKIVALSPEARFIYLTRDPVDRTISHYWHRVRWWGERRPMLAAIRADPQYTDVSHYARQLREYLRHVERERIYVLTYERLLAEPANQLSRLFNWLKVDPAVRLSFNVRTNSRPELIYQTRGYGLLARLRRTAMYTRVAPYLPVPVRHLGYRLAVKGMHPEDAPVAEVQAYLRPLQGRQTEELTALLNRSFPEWHTLQGEEHCHRWRVSNAH